MNLIRLAWKNIWRNKVRSGVILGAIAIGLFSGTIILAIMSGWIVGSVNNDIKTQYSHVQIHDTAFLANTDIEAFFMRQDVEEKIRQSNLSDLSDRMAYRVRLSGMLASAHSAVGVTAKGVQMEEEMRVTTVWEHIPDTMGVFLTDDTRMAIVISSRTADKLRVRLRSRIVFTFQDMHGDMQSIAFRVGGIYRTSNAIFDEGNVFVRHSDIFDYTGLPPGAVHEAGVWLSDIETCSIIAPQLKSMFPDMDVQEWSDLNPGLAMLIAYTGFFAFIIMGIFLFALSFGIINTMLMAVLERTRELGMLGAIGMSKRKIFNMIMLETIFLTLLGSVVGIILGVITIVPTLDSGIDLTFAVKDYFEDYGLGSILYPIFNMQMLLQIVVLVIIAGILSAIHPARKALKLKPLEAIREV